MIEYHWSGLMALDWVIRIFVAAGLFHYYLVERKKWRG